MAFMYVSRIAIAALAGINLVSADDLAAVSPSDAVAFSSDGPALYLLQHQSHMEKGPQQSPVAGKSVKTKSHKSHSEKVRQPSLLDMKSKKTKVNKTQVEKVPQPSLLDMKSKPPKAHSDKEAGQTSSSSGGVLSQPQSVMEHMSSHVGALKERLAEYQRKSKIEIFKQRDLYQKNLTATQTENNAIKAFNANLSSDIEAFEASNGNLRRQADELLKENKKLKASLQSLQSNISLAQDFVSLALNQSTELLETAPELQVMSELAKEEQERSRMAAQKHIMELAAMQVGAATHVRGKNEDAEELLKIMQGSLVDFQKEQEASAEVLRETFEQAYLKVAEQRTKLLSEQADLNSTKASALSLQENLTSAVQHLQTANEMLRRQVDAVRSFSSRLGATPTGTSLLQVDSNKGQLPTMKKVLRQPSRALDTINGHVSELQERLERINQQHMEAASEKKMEYSKQLSELEHKIAHQHKKNARIQEDIEELGNDITAMRAKAEQMVTNNQKLRSDLKFIQANITIAQEYLEQLLNDTHEPVAHTKKLRILHDLAELDAAQEAEEAHKESLKAVSMVALLQVDGAKKPHDHSAPAQDILGSLESSMEMLAEEHNASLEKLQTAFEQEFDANNKTYQKLLAKSDKLNQKKAEQIELKQRLQVAVDHLERTGQVLMKRRASLLNFAGQLAALPYPLDQGEATEMGLATGQPAKQVGAFQKAFHMLKNVSRYFKRDDGDSDVPEPTQTRGLFQMRKHLR